MVNNWANKTPGNFKFTAKFPKIITHDKRLKDICEDLEQFFEAMNPLSQKMLALLIQLLHLYRSSKDLIVSGVWFQSWMPALDMQ